MTAPRDFYCEDCRGWTRAEITEGSNPRCSGCGEFYACGECGYEIDDHGNCLRPEGHQPIGVQP